MGNAGCHQGGEPTYRLTVNRWSPILQSLTSPLFATESYPARDLKRARRRHATIVMPTEVGIQVFACACQQRRGWRACARHDEEATPLIHEHGKRRVIFTIAQLAADHYAWIAAGRRRY